jgi:hypothetical protein
VADPFSSSWVFFSTLLISLVLFDDPSLNCAAACRLWSVRPSDPVLQTARQRQGRFYSSPPYHSIRLSKFHSILLAIYPKVADRLSLQWLRGRCYIPRLLVCTCIQHGSQRPSRRHDLAQPPHGIHPTRPFGFSVWPRMPLESVDPTPLRTLGQNTTGVRVARSIVHAGTAVLGLVACDGPEHVARP